MDQLKDNSTMDLRAMIDGLVSDMGEVIFIPQYLMNNFSNGLKSPLCKSKSIKTLFFQKTKKINGLTDKIRSMENSKPGKLNQLSTFSRLKVSH